MKQSIVTVATGVFVVHRFYRSAIAGHIIGLEYATQKREQLVECVSIGAHTAARHCPAFIPCTGMRDLTTKTDPSNAHAKASVAFVAAHFQFEIFNCQRHKWKSVDNNSTQNLTQTKEVPPSFTRATLHSVNGSRLQRAAPVSPAHSSTPYAAHQVQRFPNCSETPPCHLVSRRMRVQYIVHI